MPAFADALRKYHVSLALVDQVWMPRPKQLFDRFDPITADFAYVALARRSQGNRGKNENVGQDYHCETGRRTWASGSKVLKKVHGTEDSDSNSFCQQPTTSGVRPRHASKSFEWLWKRATPVKNFIGEMEFI